MSSLDKLFANSLKNDITHSFVESVEAIMFLEGISSEDFLKLNTVKVYTPIIKNEYSFAKSTKLKFTQEYEHTETHYDILGVWLYKLSENCRRIYSALKKGNSTVSLIEQQNNLYTISNYFLEHWDTHNENTFFPRAIFGRHSDYLQPLDYLMYLGTHNSLSPENFENHLLLLQKLSPKIDFDTIPDFLPKLALSSTNSKLLKTILPLFSPDKLINSLQYGKTSDGFQILSFEYLLENSEKFILPDYTKIDLILHFLRDDILLSKHFDDFILDKSVYLQKLAQFITPQVSKGIELLFVNKSKTQPVYKEFQQYFLTNQKKSNPSALSNELALLSFEDINDTYWLSSDLIQDTISMIVLKSSMREHSGNKEYLFNNLKNLVEKLHPVLTKTNLSTIISLNNEFISFCKPVYLNIKINEKLTTYLEKSPDTTNSNSNSSSFKKNKI